MPYKRIIVAVDGSETSNIALMEALYLSKALQSKLCIIYVVDEFPAASLALGANFNRCQEIIRNDGMAILDRMKLITHQNDMLAETQLIEIIDTSKKVSVRIIEAALSWKADLLVMGTHGRRGFNRIILGSVAEETIRISPIPILIVRAKEGT